MVKGKGIDKTHYHEPNALVSALREWGLKTTEGGCWSGDKFVPEFVFELTDELIGFFLASLWDCDGHVGVKICTFKTISPKLANDVQTLLLRLGIYSTIYETQYFNNRAPPSSYKWPTYSITNVHAIHSFIHSFFVYCGKLTYRNCRG